MTKLEELKEIISEGNTLLKTKITTYEETTNYNMGVLRRETLEFNNVDETQYKNWKSKVFAFLNKNNLSNLNDVYDWKVNGNFAYVKSLLEKLENLYDLCKTLENQDINFIVSEEEIEKNILLLLHFNDIKYIDQLEIYCLMIGKDYFKEVYNKILTLEYTQIIINLNYKFSVLLPENNYLTLKGKKRYEDIKQKEMSQKKQISSKFNTDETTEKTENPPRKVDWGLIAAWVGSLGTLIAALWGIYTYFAPAGGDNHTTTVNNVDQSITVKANQQAAPVNIIGSGNNVIVQQNQK